MKRTLRCQQDKINDKELTAILTYICEQSNKVYNCCIVYGREFYKKTGKIPNEYDMCNEMSRSKNRHFKSMYISSAQQSCKAAAAAFKSFKALRIRHIDAKLPNQRKSDVMPVSYAKRWLKLTDKGIRVPLGKQVSAWFKIDCFHLKLPERIKWDRLIEIRVVPRYGNYYVEYVYEIETKNPPEQVTQALGIDHGVDNWLTCVSTVGTSFIIDGRHVKSLNQWFNKISAKLLERLGNKKESQQLQRIRDKRSRQMRDAANKAARIVVNHCLEHKINCIVFGWTENTKTGMNLGKRNNQNLMHIPTSKVKNRLEELCAENGIKFIITEESYTSKASYLDKDRLPVYGQDVKDWKASGKRVKRGLYRTKNNLYVNADANGAANILRKVAGTLGLDLKELGRGALTTPLRIRLWTT